MCIKGFWGEIPLNPNFGGVNRHFQAIRVKCHKYHIIGTTASISTKFCTIIETTKWSSWVIPLMTNKHNSFFVISILNRIKRDGVYPRH